MSLLSFEGVGKRTRSGLRQQSILRDVSLQIEIGELAVVWGTRGSGRSTLLRIAAGIQAPDSGVVRFEGRDLSARREHVLGDGIGYCQRGTRCAEGQAVIEQVTVGLLARGLAPRRARTRAMDALERAGVQGCSSRSLDQLDSGEAVRVSLARALALEPRLLVIDEPTKGVELLERDGVLGLLRSLADEQIAVLASTGEAAGLSGADRTLALSEGELRGPFAPELAQVVSIGDAAKRRASG